MPFVGRQTARYHDYTCTKTLGLTISAGRGARWGQRRWQCCSNSLLPFQINRKGASEAGRWPLRAIEGSLPKIFGLFRKHWFVFQGASPDAYQAFHRVVSSIVSFASSNLRLQLMQTVHWGGLTSSWDGQRKKAGKDDAKEEKVEKEASAANLQHRFQSSQICCQGNPIGCCRGSSKCRFWNGGFITKTGMCCRWLHRAALTLENSMKFRPFPHLHTFAICSKA